jgi:hypothetical protein
MGARAVFIGIHGRLCLGGNSLMNIGPLVWIPLLWYTRAILGGGRTGK